MSIRALSYILFFISLFRLLETVVILLASLSLLFDRVRSFLSWSTVGTNTVNSLCVLSTSPKLYLLNMGQMEVFKGLHTKQVRESYVKELKDLVEGICITE